MTIHDVIARGVTFRREHGTPEKMALVNQLSLARWEMLQCVLEARRLNLRTANRRYRRRVGKDFRNA